MRLPVGRRLYAGFLTILALMTAVCWIGLGKMAEINEKGDQINAKWLPKVDLVHQLKYLTEHALALEMKYILAERYGPSGCCHPVDYA
ncbi:MAG: MCP four helix bundle domain-containing protein [Brevibacillus sp.]|nr:MCP four helix bundle domain-containing protein [Brevibacillus sp.]